jgi:hypothetical protein
MLRTLCHAFNHPRENGCGAVPFPLAARTGAKSQLLIQRSWPAVFAVAGLDNFSEQAKVLDGGGTEIT